MFLLLDLYLFFLLSSLLLHCLLFSSICISITDHMIKDLSEIRREVDEHFERCIHALEARQHTLLTYLDQIAQYQGVFICLTYLSSSFISPLFITPSPLITYVEELQENTSKQIKGLMLLCTKYMEAGSTLYTINRSAAENIWQVSNPLSSSHLF